MDAWEPASWPPEPPPPPPLTVDAEHALLIFAGAACWLAACGAAVNGTVLRFVLPHLALLAASGCFAGCAPLTYTILCFGAWACLALSRASPRSRRHNLGVGRSGWRGRSAERGQAEAGNSVGGVFTQLEQVIREELETRPRQLRELGPEVRRYARRACCWLWRRVEGRPGAEAVLAVARELRSTFLALALYCSEEGQYPPGYLEFDRMLRLCVVITCRGLAKAKPTLLCHPESESLLHLAQTVGETLLAGIRDSLGQTVLSVPSFSSSPASVKLLVFCYWLPCAMGFDIVRCLLICALVFTAAHCKLLASDLGAADPPPAHAVALWLHVRRRPRRLVLSLLIAALGVPLSWMFNTTVLTLVVPPVLILLYYKPELQDSLSLSVAAAIQPLVDCMPSLQEMEAALTLRLTSCLTPFETFVAQVQEVQESDEALFKKCLCGGLSAGLCFTVLGFLGSPFVGAVLHVLLCCGLALAAEVPPDGKGQQLACKIHGVAIGLAAFVTAELAIGGYVLLLGPQALHLEAQICLGPWLEDLVGPWLGLILGPMLASEASTRLGPHCRAWLGVFYEPLLGSELGKDVGSTLGSWLGVAVGAWGGHLIGGYVGALLGVWLAGPVSLLGLPLVWLAALAVWLQVQFYDPGFAVRRALFDLWLWHARLDSNARVLDLGVASSADSTTVLSATLQKLEPGHGPLLVQFSDAGEDSEPSILMRCWVGHLAEAIVDADPLPMLVRWEEGSKVYSLNYEWLPFYRSTCGSSSRPVVSQARLAALEASSADAFRQLGVVFGCCLLEGQCLVKTSPILFSRLAEAEEAFVSSGPGNVIMRSACGAKDMSALQELCPAIAETLRTAAASAGADPLEVQLPARGAAPLDPLRVSAPGCRGRPADRLAALGTSAAEVLENGHVAPLLGAFRNGFSEAVGLPELPELFSPLEVRRLLAGERLVDVEDWERHARYSEGLSAASPSVRLFWAALRELPQEELQALCKLATGLPTPPLGGFGALSPPFVLARQRDILVKIIMLYTHQSVVELPRCRGGLPDMRKKVAAVISVAKVPTEGGNGRRPR